MGLCGLGKLGRDVLLLRQGEEIGMRLRCSIPNLAESGPHAAEVKARCEMMLEAVNARQFELFKVPASSSPILQVDARAGFVLRAAQSNTDTDLARVVPDARIALEDYLLEPAKLSHQLAHMRSRRRANRRQRPVGRCDAQGVPT